MGNYLYYLRTKSRRIKTLDGSETITVFPLECAGKPSYRPEPWEVAMNNRLANIWAVREAPEYVAWGGFDNANNGKPYKVPVYKGWKKGDYVVNDGGDLPHTILAGYLVGTGRAMRFEKWNVLESEAESLAAAREALTGMLSDEHHLTTVGGIYRRPDEPFKVRLSCRSDEDFVRAKIALA